MRWGGLPATLKPLFWTHPTTFDSLTLDQDLDLILYQVLAYGDVERWQRNNPGAAIWEDR